MLNAVESIASPARGPSADVAYRQGNFREAIGLQREEIDERLSRGLDVLDARKRLALYA